MRSYTYISTCTTHLHHDHKARITSTSAKHLPDNSFAPTDDSILLSFVYKPHHNAFLHHCDNISSDTDADTQSEYIDPKHPPVQIYIYGTPQLCKCLAYKPNSNKYFDIFNNEIGLLSPFSYNNEDQLANRCIKHTLSRAVINELFGNHMMVTVSKFALFCTVFRKLHRMST